MDETSKQLLADKREPIPAKPGSPKKIDYEYEREGVANIFIFFEPLMDKRLVKVTERRTRKDWALAMRKLSDVQYPDAEVIDIVMDNLNTHSPASFYLNRRRHIAWLIALSFTIHLSMAIGLISQKSN